MEQTNQRLSLSVVVVSLNSASTLKDCLVSLERQSVREGFEVIVVDSSNDGSREMVRRQFPGVRLLEVDYPGSRALMRSLGVREAKGEIVAITEDHCAAREDWVERIIENHRAPVAAVGGAVENSAEDRAAYWAIYFCHYYRFMAPVPAGPVADIPGSNAAYKRSALAKTEFDKIGLWDNLIATQLGANSGTVISDPSQVIYHDERQEPFRFLVHRFHYSRCFAGLRAQRVSTLRRLFYLTFSPALPALVLWRTCRAVWEKRRNRAKLVRCLPLLVTFLIGSAAGEFTGYLTGPGNSWRKID